MLDIPNYDFTGLRGGAMDLAGLIAAVARERDTRLEEMLAAYYLETGAIMPLVRQEMGDKQCFWVTRPPSDVPRFPLSQHEQDKLNHAPRVDSSFLAERAVAPAAAYKKRTTIPASRVVLRSYLQELTWVFDYIQVA